jgi:hypothetical protein
LKAVTYAFPPGYRENAEEEEKLLVSIKGLLACSRGIFFLLG